MRQAAGYQIGDATLLKKVIGGVQIEDGLHPSIIFLTLFSRLASNCSTPSF